MPKWWKSSVVDKKTKKKASQFVLIFLLIAPHYLQSDVVWKIFDFSKGRDRVDVAS